KHNAAHCLSVPAGVRRIESNRDGLEALALAALVGLGLLGTAGLAPLVFLFVLVVVEIVEIILFVGELVGFDGGIVIRGGCQLQIARIAREIGRDILIHLGGAVHEEV